MGGVAAIGHRPHRRARQEGQQPFGLGQFRRLARGEHERDRPATNIGEDVPLGPAAAARAAERLSFGVGLGRPILLAGARGLLMRTDHRAVEERHAELEPALLLHQPMHALPHPALGPADEGLRRHPPRAKFGRDRAPLGPVLLPPHDRLDRSAKLPDRPRRPRPGLVQQRLEHAPLLVRQHNHAISLPVLLAESRRECPSHHSC